MTKFEEYLIEQGFKCYHIDTRKKRMKKVNGYANLSSMTNLFNAYEKDGLVIEYGLFEHGYPPSICYPRPYVISNGKCRQADRFYMDKLMKENSYEQLVEILKKRTVEE